MEDFGLWVALLRHEEMQNGVHCMLSVALLDTGRDQGFSYVHRVGRGGPIGRDGLFIKGNVELNQRVGQDANTLRSIRAADRAEALQWMTRRDVLATHLEYCKHNL
jgi:hypothetical protein